MTPDANALDAGKQNARDARRLARVIAHLKKKLATNARWRAKSPQFPFLFAGDDRLYTRVLDIAEGRKTK